MWKYKKKERGKEKRILVGVYRVGPRGRTFKSL